MVLAFFSAFRTKRWVTPVSAETPLLTVLEAGLLVPDRIWYSPLRRRMLARGWSGSVFSKPTWMKSVPKAGLVMLAPSTVYLVSAPEVPASEIPAASRLAVGEWLHVVHTYDFLSRIPWGKNFCNVPDIAGAHHEKLNGTGYPRGWTTEQIPLASKIMTIADIYDALTARDRPYKKAVPRERALAILGFEVKDGNIDGDLVKAFTDAEVFREVEDRDLSY